MPTADYQRVAEDLRRRLAGGEWSPGEQLPPRAQLAREYRTSPAAVQRGQELLIDAGLLEGRKSVGVFVRTPQARIALPVLLPIPDAIRRAGLTPAVEYRSDVKVPAPEPIARRLAVAVDTLCVRTRYEFLGNARPLALGESWEPMALTHRTPVLLPEDGPLAGTGVARRMASVGIRVRHAHARTHARHPSDLEALRLGITRRTLVVRLERTHLTDTGQPVETATFLLPQPRWELVYDIPVPAYEPAGDDLGPWEAAGSGHARDDHAREGRARDGDARDGHGREDRSRDSRGTAAVSPRGAGARGTRARGTAAQGADAEGAGTKGADTTGPDTTGPDAGGRAADGRRTNRGETPRGH